MAVVRALFQSRDCRTTARNTVTWFFIRLIIWLNNFVYKQGPVKEPCHLIRFDALEEWRRRDRYLAVRSGDPKADPPERLGGDGEIASNHDTPDTKCRALQLYSRRSSLLMGELSSQEYPGAHVVILSLAS